MKKSLKFYRLTLFAMFVFGTFLVSCQEEKDNNKITPDTEVIASPANLPDYAGENNVFANGRTTDVACQCLIYIRNCTNLPRNANSVSAADYGAVLSANSYVSRTSPALNDIVIFGRGFGGGISTVHGHIGYISAFERIGTGSTAYWRIKIRSANWIGTKVYSGCNCSNVEDSGWINVNTNARKTNISYWRR